MAAVTAINGQAVTKRSDSIDPIQVAFITFDLTGTYVQADNASVDAATILKNSRRNGKTYTILGATLGQLARRDSDSSLFLGAKTIAIVGNQITFEVTASAVAGVPDLATELGAGAMPATYSPFGMYVSYLES